MEIDFLTWNGIILLVFQYFIYFHIIVQTLLVQRWCITMYKTWTKTEWYVWLLLCGAVATVLGATAVIYWYG